MPSCFRLILISVACTSPLTSGFLSTSRPTSITSTGGSCAFSATIPTTTVPHRTATSRLSLEIPNFFGGGSFNFNPFGDNNDGDKDDAGEKNKPGDTVKYGGGADGAIDPDGDGEYIMTTEIFHIPGKFRGLRRSIPTTGERSILSAQRTRSHITHIATTLNTQHTQNKNTTQPRRSKSEALDSI